MHAALLPADWPAPKNIRAFTTLRQGLGVSKAPFDAFNLGLRAGDDLDAVRRNRELLVEHAALPASPEWLRQVHGSAVWRFDGGSDGGFSGQVAGESVARIATEGRDDDTIDDVPQGDAAVTSTTGTVLAILTADCLPVLFCADDGSEVAAAHAGWRGLADGVLEATVAAMTTPPQRVLAWLGPAAGPLRYEVGIDVYDAFVAKDWASGGAFTSTRPDHWHVDLYTLARRRLTQAGLAATNIHGGDLCTISDPQRFYSHRRDRRSGRMASLVWMEPAP
ncbi:peptidoglycan editing factor PgeF [Lysobacter fragariae]